MSEFMMRHRPIDAIHNVLLLLTLHTPSSLLTVLHASLTLSIQRHHKLLKTKQNTREYITITYLPADNTQQSILHSHFILPLICPIQPQVYSNQP